MPLGSNPRVEWRCPHCARLVESSRAYCAACDEDSPPIPVEPSIGRLIDSLVDRVEVLERQTARRPRRGPSATRFLIESDPDYLPERFPPRPGDPNNYTEFLSDEEAADVMADGMLDQILPASRSKPN